MKMTIYRCTVCGKVMSKEERMLFDVLFFCPKHHAMIKERFNEILEDLKTKEYKQPQLLKECIEKGHNVIQFLPRSGEIIEVCFDCKKSREGDMI